MSWRGSGRGPVGGEAFSTTHWSMVLAAAGGQDSDSRRALATLCETYWYPVYAYVRRRGYDPESAQDLTQGFFARFLEKESVKAARRERGRFRNFLLDPATQTSRVFAKCSVSSQKRAPSANAQSGRPRGRDGSNPAGERSGT